MKMINFEMCVEDDNRVEFVSGLRDFYFEYDPRVVVEEEEVFAPVDEVTWIEVTDANVDEICAWIRAYNSSTAEKPFKIAYRTDGRRTFVTL